MTVPPELIPGMVCPGFLCIDFAALASRGLHFLILDVDNTISGLGAVSLIPGVVEHLHAAREAGHLRGLCLVSNVMLGRHKVLRVERFARELDAHFVAADWRAPKPSPLPFRAALQRMACEPSETVVVGDQVYTDVRGGNRLGMFTVLVPPLGPDHWTTRLIGRRVRERRVLAALGLI
ncbi:MAG: HAD-IIIA family hydrolase [Armatimonadetes bacterium]|nr:HAD-IIIA family hydrolase [Armatimonadota bacterium]